MSHKIGVVGDKNSVLPFKMLGFSTHFAYDGETAKNIIRDMEKDGYGVIYVTEELAAEIPEYIRTFDSKVIPAIIMIPNHSGSKGLGKKRVQENVKKAIGQNIL
jgi:V/A-type H+-transporting ATPase subunit F